MSEISLNDFMWYYAILNLISFLSMAYDKRTAIQGKKRIPEKILMIFSLMGGFLGIILGGLVFLHKTKKRSFHFKISLMIWLHVLLIYFVFKG